VSQKTGPFFFLFSITSGQILSYFNNYFLTLLHTEINYDQVHHKISHRPYLKPASALPCNMNKNVLADVAGMIS